MRMNRYAAALLATQACSGAPAPAPSPATAPASAQSAAGAAPAGVAPRWIRADGVTELGVRVAGGRLVLLGGKRAVLAADGSVRMETHATPEPLRELLRVPGAPGKKHWVGRDRHRVLRFDDLLGAPRVLATVDRLDHLGALPGLVAVWDRTRALPRLLDPTTGAEGTMALPPLAAGELTFLDARVGAGLFEGSGLAVTRDGGASWQLAAEPPPTLPWAQRPFGIDADDVVERDEGLVATGQATLRVDPLHTRVETMPDAAPPEAPLERWIRYMGWDPLAAAIAGGVDAGDGTALVAGAGVLLRVELATGKPLWAKTIGERDHIVTCPGTRDGAHARFVCSTGEGLELLTVRLADGEVLKKRPRVQGYVQGVRTSAAGGVMVQGSCEDREAPGGCVLSRDGTFRTVALAADRLGAAPGRDGELVALRSELRDGERTLELVATRAGGEEESLGEVRVPKHEDVTVLGHLDQDAAGTWYALLRSGERWLHLRRAPEGQPTVSRVPVRGAPGMAAIHGARGAIRLDERTLLVTTDGVAWREVALPDLEGLGDVYSELTFHGHRRDGWLATLGSAGIWLWPLAHVGWDGIDDPPAALTAAPAAPASPTPAAPLAHSLSCTTAGAAKNGPLLQRVAEEAPSDGVSVSSRGVARLLESPTTWTFEWIDDVEVGAQLRSVSAKAPADAEPPSALVGSIASGKSAVFVVDSGNHRYFYRVVGGRLSAPARFERGMYQVVPEEPFLWHGSFTAAGDTAWHSLDAVVAWPAGSSEVPRTIAYVRNTPGTSSLAVAAPKGGAVPLLVAAYDPDLPWAGFALAPIAVTTPAAIAPSSWSDAAAAARPESLDACSGQPPVHRFVLNRPSGTITVDGVTHSLAAVDYDLRVNASSACIAGLSAQPSFSGGTAWPERISLVRADLLDGRADGGNEDENRALTCTWN
jgi:hypothetical protein